MGARADGLGAERGRSRFIPIRRHSSVGDKVGGVRGAYDLHVGVTRAQDRLDYLSLTPYLSSSH